MEEAVAQATPQAVTMVEVGMHSAGVRQPLVGELLLAWTQVLHWVVGGTGHFPLFVALLCCQKCCSQCFWVEMEHSSHHLQCPCRCPHALLP